MVKTTALPSQALIKVIVTVFMLITCGAALTMAYLWRQSQQANLAAHQLAQVQKTQLASYSAQLQTTQEQLQSVQASLSAIQNTNQFKRNQELQNEITQIHDQFQKTVSAYEDTLKLKELGLKVQPLDNSFTRVLVLLSNRNYSSASAELTHLNTLIQQQLALTQNAAPTNAPEKDSPPNSGISRQSVQTDVGKFGVDILAADLNTARVQVVTSSGGDCGNNCPVGALMDFVSQVHGFAGINGPYFCPASYPSCAGKTNSFDTLLMNYHKTYFNSSNNVYSVVPAVIFSGGSARFVSQSLQWGRDTGVDAVIAAQPALILNGNIAFGGDNDPKKTSRTTRAFIGAKGSTVYIGMVHGATIVEVAHVMKTLGIPNALNLDDAGSAAMVVNGHYVVGPGRATPFGIVLVRK